MGYMTGDDCKTLAWTGIQPLSVNALQQGQTLAGIYQVKYQSGEAGCVTIVDFVLAYIHSFQAKSRHDVESSLF